MTYSHVHYSEIGLKSHRPLDDAPPPAAARGKNHLARGVYSHYSTDPISSKHRRFMELSVRVCTYENGLPKGARAAATAQHHHPPREMGHTITAYMHIFTAVPRESSTPHNHAPRTTRLDRIKYEQTHTHTHTAPWVRLQPPCVRSNMIANVRLHGNAIAIARQMRRPSLMCN